MKMFELMLFVLILNVVTYHFSPVLATINGGYNFADTQRSNSYLQNAQSNSDSMTKQLASGAGIPIISQITGFASLVMGIFSTIYNIFFAIPVFLENIGAPSYVVFLANVIILFIYTIGIVQMLTGTGMLFQW